VKGFFDAVSLLTRLRTRGGSDTERALPWMPVVGALVGVAVALVYVAARAVIAPWVSASLAIATGILITGALHEDGLADVADAFGARVDRARAIEILQDPHHGTYGVLAMILSVVTRIGAVATMGSWTALAALPAAHSLGRAGSLGLMSSIPAADSSTLGASYKRHPIGNGAVAGFAFASALSIVMLGFWSPVAIGIVIVASLGVGLLSIQKIGGFNGDVLGAIEQLSEIGILLLVAAARHDIPWWHA
jgi:adenosylcobinamide-GDP ribazoletransferase